MGNMVGASGRLSQNNGEIAFIRPSQQRLRLEYINIQNTTENTLKIFGLNDDINSSYPTYQIGGRMAISLKLTQKLSEGVVVTFNNPDPSTNDQIKPVEIIWSDISKDWNSSLAPSYTSDYVGANVNVINTPTVDIGVQDTSTFENDYVDTPLSSSINNDVTVLTQAGVVGKSWYISYINCGISGTSPVGAGNVQVVIKDGADIIYRNTIPAAAVNGTNLSLVLPSPIKIRQGNSFSYEIGSPSNDGCIIYANIGAFNK